MDSWATKSMNISIAAISFSKLFSKAERVEDH